MAIIEDYDHMKTMNENVKSMKLTCLYLILSLNLRGPFWIPTFASLNIIAFLDVHIFGAKNMLQPINSNKSPSKQ